MKAAAGVLINPIAVKLDTLEALVEKAAAPCDHAPALRTSSKHGACMVKCCYTHKGSHKEVLVTSQSQQADIDEQVKCKVG